MSAEIHIRNLKKAYGQNVIIPKLDLDIKNGEFFTLLGPSGCGKTTLLRMIAGFNTIEGGTISFGDEVINDIPAHKRNIGMVFQNYAIFPHLTVLENIKYGLKVRKLSQGEMDERIAHILDVTQIAEYKDRLPERLSGGQQQRVALARAIVVHPTVLLMDEPLSNLDAKLRVEMRSAIRQIQEEIGITTVYVTHDQEEALAISDRIAVMKSGVIQQTGKPQDIYTRPANLFVGGFIGHSNFFHASLSGGNRVQLSKDYSVQMDVLRENLPDQGAVAGVRPEDFRISETGEGMPVTIKKCTFLGRYVNYVLDCPECDVVKNEEEIEFSQDISMAREVYPAGTKLRLLVDAGKINLYTADGEESLVKGVRQYD